MLAIVREKGSWHGEITRVRKDGMRVQLEISSIALYDSKGKVTGFVSVNRDISVEKALQNSEAELQALFASMKDLVIIYNKEGRYLKIASKDTSMLIKNPEDLLGKTIHEFFPKEEADRFVRHIQTVLETQKTMPIECRLRARGGSSLDFHYLFVFFRDDIIDFGHRRVGGFLYLLQARLLLVLGDVFVLEELFQHLVGITAGVAQGYLAVFGHLLDHLDQILAPFLGERRHGQTHDFAIGRWVEPEAATNGSPSRSQG